MDVCIVLGAADSAQVEILASTIVCQTIGTGVAGPVALALQVHRPRISSQNTNTQQPQFSSISYYYVPIC